MARCEKLIQARLQSQSLSQCPLCPQEQPLMRVEKMKKEGKDAEDGLPQVTKEFYKKLSV